MTKKELEAILKPIPKHTNWGYEIILFTDISELKHTYINNLGYSDPLLWNDFDIRRYGKRYMFRYGIE